MIWMEDYREFLREQQIFMWGFWSTMLAFPIPMRASSMSLMKNSPRTCSVWTLKSQHVWSNSFFHPCWNTNEEPLSMLVLALAVCCPRIPSTPSMQQQKRMSIIHPLGWNINQELMVIWPADSYIYRKEISHTSCYIYVYVLIVGGGSWFIKHCTCSSVWWSFHGILCEQVCWPIVKVALCGVQAQWDWCPVPSTFLSTLFFCSFVEPHAFFSSVSGS